MNQEISNSEQESGLTLQELLVLLWDGKWILAASAIVAGVLALAYLFIATPIYKVDALVQVEDKKGGATAMFGEMGAMFDVASPAETEIEIIKSRMVLGKVVQDLKLDIVTQVKTLPIVGKALLRRNPNPPRIEVDRFDVPETLWSETLVLTHTGNQYQLQYEKQTLLQGKVGELAQAVYQGDTLQLFVSALEGPDAQQYLLSKLSPLTAMENLSGQLSAMEKGKKTGMILLSLQGPNPKLATQILNAVAQSYVQQNVDRKSAEAAKTLEFLRSQLPELKRNSDSAESALNNYRLQVGSIDLNAESKLILDQGVDLQSEVMKLQAQKTELLRLYKEDHPNIQTLDRNIQMLETRMGGVNSQVRRLPKTQQEILRLAQEAKVAAEVYNTMLNNAQQLEVAKAGQVGNVRVIDPALASLVPVKPKKSSTLVLIVMLGLFVGAGILLLLRFWNKGIQDPKVLESKLGIPVYASIPHSQEQRKVLEAIRKHIPGLKLLTTQAPDDLATEAFRSLRTTLHFSMHDASNNILLLVGPSPAIGKSFVSSNLAVVLAQTGKRICLVDADMRRGHLHDAFDLKREPGLSDHLVGSITAEQAIQSTQHENLFIVTTGQVPPNPSELLFGKNAQDFLEYLSKQFDLVIVDSPPLLAVADALVLAKLAGTTLMVLKHAKHSLSEIEATINRLDHAGQKIKGCIFNDVRLSSGGKYGSVYQYGYGKGK